MEGARKGAGRATLVAGGRVRLHSLNSIVYNGMTGQVLGWDEVARSVDCLCKLLLVCH
jgi:hypothetical protein